MEKQSLTLNEACELLGVSRETARKWIEIGRLKATRKDTTKPKSPYLITPDACREALTNPAYGVPTLAAKQVSLQSNATHHLTQLPSREGAAEVLRKMLAHRTKGRG
ncbi:TPA: helix-turn-helix domain-containing protein [Serratia liquefaciens]